MNTRREKLLIALYAVAVKSGTKSIDDVPESIRDRITLMVGPRSKKSEDNEAADEG